MMCERLANETWWSYAFRATVEKPVHVLFVFGLMVMVSGFAAAGFIYSDMRGFFDAQADVLKEQSQVLQQMGLEFKEMNVRLQHLERK